MYKIISFEFPVNWVDSAFDNEWVFKISFLIPRVTIPVNRTDVIRNVCVEGTVPGGRSVMTSVC